MLNRSFLQAGRIAGALALLLSLGTPAVAIQNGRYKLTVEKDSSVDVTAHGHTENFRARFTVVTADQNPHLRLTTDKETAFRVPT